MERETTVPAPNGPYLLSSWLGLSLTAQIFLVPTISIFLYIIKHVLQQLVFVDKTQPPVVFSWLPLIGSTVEYGIEPYKFYAKYQKKV